jgi:hypothetical protein
METAHELQQLFRPANLLAAIFGGLHAMPRNLNSFHKVFYRQGNSVADDVEQRFLVADRWSLMHIYDSM